VASKGDPSIDHDDGMTSNPWPSSDWIAMLAERGLLATLAFGLAYIGLAVLAFRAIRNSLDLDEFLPPLTLLATLAATIVVGCFDASLLLAAPTLFVFALIGALSPPAARRMTIPLSTATARGLALVGSALAIALLLSVRSASQLVAMGMFSSASTIAEYDRAAVADPGSYRIQIRIAELGAERTRCDLVKPHAMRAHELFPAAAEPAHLLASCGVKLKRR